MTGGAGFAVALALVYVAVMAAPGVGLVAWSLRGRGLRWPTALAVALAGGMTLAGFGALAAGLVPGVPVLAVVWALALAGLATVVVQRRRGQLPRVLASGTRGAWRGPALPVGLAALAGVVLLVAVHSLAVHYWAWDAWSIWDLKSRLLAHHLPTGDWQERLRDPALGFTHPAYPLGLPLQRAIAYLMAATPYTQLGKLSDIIWFCVFALALWSLARQRLAAGPATLLTAGALAMPAAISWASSGFAEIPVAALYAVALLALREFHRAPTRWGAPLGVTLAGLAFMKNEGLVLAALVGGLAVLIAWRSRRPDRWRGLALTVGLAGVLIAPWLLARAGLPATDENYPEHLRLAVIQQNLGRLPEILRTLGAAFVDLRTWGVLWLALPVAAVIGARAWRRRETQLAWALLLAHLCVYCLVWVITPWDITTLLDMTVDRLLLQISPLLVLLLATHLAAALRPRRQ